MVSESYRRTLEAMTLEELRAELDTERDALKELLDEGRNGPPYDDWGRQVDATRDNIDFIKSLIGRKSR